MRRPPVVAPNKTRGGEKEWKRRGGGREATIEFERRRFLTSMDSE